MRSWHILNCIVHNQDAEATEMIARPKGSSSNRLRHPINNWSNTDLQTILKEPLGSTPERVQWSVSVVLTPKGWIGRIDNYVKGITRDLEVEPNVGEYFQQIRELDKKSMPYFPSNENIIDFDDEEDTEYEEYGQDDYDAALEALLDISDIYPDPTVVTLAEVLEEAGVDWKAAERKIR